MKYRTIDLCAGIGGIRRGFELTQGFENVLSAENDPYAVKTYKHLYGDDPGNDVTSESFKDKVSQTAYDVLLAGFPCQSFSRAGHKKGFRDSTRGTLFFDIADILSRTHPSAVFLENVENLVAHNNGSTIRTILETLEHELGYRIIGVTLDENRELCYTAKSFIRNSRHFGLPQNRPRVYMMGFSKKIFGEAVKSLTRPLPDGNRKIIYKSVHEILEPEVDIGYYMASGYWDTLKKHKERQTKSGNGFGYCIVNRKKGAYPTANSLLATGGAGKERNLIWQPRDGVGGTILTRKRTPLNDEGIRTMTPTEWGRLQGFVGYAFVEKGVDRFSFPAGLTDVHKYKQLGNSVTIPVIETMAAFMLDCFEAMKGSVSIVRKGHCP